MDIFSVCVNMIFLGTVAERKEFRQVQQLMGVRHTPERWPLRGVQDQEPNRWSIFSIYPYQLSSQFYMEIRLSKKAAQPACVATHVPRSAQDLVVRTKTKVKMKLYAASCLLTPRPLN